MQKYYKKPWQRVAMYSLDLLVNMIVILAIFYTLVWTVMPQNIAGHVVLFVLAWRLNAVIVKQLENKNVR